MAPKQKRVPPLHDPPPADSEEDQERSHEEEDDEDDDDDDEEGATASSDEQEDDEEEEKYRLSRAAQPAHKNPSSQSQSQSQSQPPKSHPKPPSSPDTESATESDSDSEPNSPAPTPTPKVKPPASKPKEQAPKVKPQSSSSGATQAKSASKRPAENNGHSSDPKQAKKKKLADGASASDEEDAKKLSRDDSKKLFQRVFSDQDEVTILEGVVDFRSATGGDDPYKCAEAFHDFMKKRSKLLSFDASSAQLKEKIRRLKTKYNNIARRGKNGEGPRFSKPHEQRAFELSQLVWSGAERGAGNGAMEKTKPGDGKAGKGTPNPKKDISSENAVNPKLKPEAKAKPNSELQLPSVDSKEFGKIDERPESSAALSSMVKCDKGMGEYGLGEDFLRKGDALMEASKRAEFEVKWRKLEAAELDLRVKRAELYANHAKLMLQAIKSSKN